MKTNNVPAVSLYGPSADSFFGYAVSALDFDGDNFTDMAISAITYAAGGKADSGRVYVVRGANNLPAERDMTNSAHFLLALSSGSLLMQILVSIAGIATMTLVAYYISWSKRQDKPLPKAPAPPKPAASAA